MKKNIVLYSILAVILLFVIGLSSLVFSSQCRLVQIPFTNIVIYTRSSYESICVLASEPEIAYEFPLYLPFVSVIDTHASAYTQTTDVILTARDQQDLHVISSVVFPRVIAKVAAAQDISAEFNTNYPHASSFPYISDTLIVHYESEPKTLYLSSKSLSKTDMDKELDTYLKTLKTSLAEMQTLGVVLKYNAATTRSGD